MKQACKPALMPLSQAAVNTALWWHYRWLQANKTGVQANFTGLPLIGLDLHNRDLRGISFKGSLVRDCTFSGSNLDDCRL